MWILDLSLTLLYPPRCPSCARALRRTAEPGLCRGCVAQLEPPGPACPSCGEPGSDDRCAACVASPPPFTRARACFVYREGELSSALLQRWKYHRDHVVGRSLERLFATHRQRPGECYDVLVPVPLHASRLASRGFNQAALLARAALLAGERLAPQALRRSSVTQSQASLGRSARAGNVLHAFEIAAPGSVRGSSVLLVDDVLTTGATARACATVLRAAGATTVDVWTLARTPRSTTFAADRGRVPGPSTSGLRGAR